MGKKSKKQIRKLIDKECFFCGEKEYKLLDCHRIVEGEHGGTYDWLNTLTACCNCHRKIHSGIIEIQGRFYSTKGKYVVIYKENGIEKFK